MYITVCWLKFTVLGFKIEELNVDFSKLKHIPNVPQSIPFICQDRTL